MIKVLFICHGNICRSTMAQSVFQYMVDQSGLSDQFHIDSAATSREEIGNPPHRGTQRKLRQVGIPCIPHRARQMCREESGQFDYIIGMDEMNLRNIMRILRSDPENKVHLLLDYTDRPGAIADPWYTGNFEATYRDVCEGCEGFLESLGV